MRNWLLGIFIKLLGRTQSVSPASLVGAADYNIFESNDVMHNHGHRNFNRFTNKSFEKKISITATLTTSSSQIGSQRWAGLKYKESLNSNEIDEISYNLVANSPSFLPSKPSKPENKQLMAKKSVYGSLDIMV